MISTKGRYALHIMIDLAQHNDGSFIPLKDISARQTISKKYLEIIIKELVVNNLVDSLAGKGGGYKLNKAPEDYTVEEILVATEGTLAPIACLKEDAKECPNAFKCDTLPFWKEYYDLIHNFFKNKHLTDLLPANGDSDDYVI